MDKETPQTEQPVYMRINPGDPLVITFMDGESFTTEKYKIGDKYVTAIGKWSGEGSKKTIMIPITAIRCMDFIATEVPEEEVPPAVVKKYEQAEHAVG